MKIVKLGKKPEAEIAIAMPVSKEESPEHFPTVYLDHKDLPKLKVGDKVVLHGVVAEFGERTRDVKDKTEKNRNMEIEIQELHSEGKADKEDEPSDEDEIDKGLDESKSKTQEDEE